MGRSNDGGQRPHKPHELGPRVFKRGEGWAIDLRPWDGGRPTVRDPDANGWPRKGPRARSRGEADRWRWAYVEHLEEKARRDRLGIAPRFRTLGDACRAYIRHRESVVEPNTVKATRTALLHLREHLGDEAAPERLTPGVVQKIIESRMHEGYKPSTVRTYYAYISGFATWLGFDEATRGIELPRLPRPDTSTWSPDDLERIREGADRLDRTRRSDSPSARLAVETAVCTGARLRELFALEWGSFDLATRTVRISRQIEKGGDGFTTPKGKRGRTAVVLPRWWEFYRESDSGLVLPGRDGARYHHHQPLVNRILDEAGLNEPGLGWHSFRHTYARLFIELGARLEELQKSLGHASITTTERSYGHFRGDTAARLAVASIYGRPQLRAVDGGG